MKLQLFLFCLNGLVPVALSTVIHTYHLIMTPATWSAAQNYCRETYDDLAVIESANDWLRIAAEALSKFMIFPAWIGLYNNVDSWRWTFNNLPLTMTLSNWQTSEPAEGSNACGAINGNGYWFAYPCTNLKAFFCFDSSLSGSARFILYALPPLDWLAAQAYCRKVHTDLAIVTDSTENDEIKSKVPFMNTPWIGLYRDTWTWIDGTIASNIPWVPLQPDNLHGEENCGTFTTGLISDDTCTYKYAFFCHSTPPVKHRQIIRLQVKSDGSVLNPDVQLSILEQIKKTMNENGMNPTVTWKVQSDGNIFHKKNKATL